MNSSFHPVHPERFVRRVLFCGSSAFRRPSSLPPRRYSSLPAQAGLRHPLSSPSTLNLESEIPTRSGLSIGDSDLVGTSVSSSLRSPALPNCPCNSHGIISFADPPPLNPIESYRSTKGGGRGASLQQQSFLSCPVLRDLSSTGHGSRIASLSAV